MCYFAIHLRGQYDTVSEFLQSRRWVPDDGQALCRIPGAKSVEWLVNRRASQRLPVKECRMTMKSTFLFNFRLAVVVAARILVFPASDIFAIDGTSVRVALPDTSADPSISIDIPVTVTEMTGGPGVFSAGIDITYDSSVLQATAVKKGT